MKVDYRRQNSVFVRFSLLIYSILTSKRWLKTSWYTVWCRCVVSTANVSTLLTYLFISVTVYDTVEPQLRVFISCLKNCSRFFLVVLTMYDAIISRFVTANVCSSLLMITLTLCCQCSVLCGGGRRQRELLCFTQQNVSETLYCDSNTRPHKMEDCNVQPCDEGLMTA